MVRAKILTLTLGGVPMALLRKLHATGLYGLTVEDTAERLLLDRLRTFIEQDDLLLRLPKIPKGRSRRG